MASEEPLFDPSLKKRKKKAVAFTEDPLGRDADPTTPAPETIDNTTLNGDAVDLGPTTAHEMMKEKKKEEEEELKAMFGDIKKKKKKKEIPMDLGDGSGTSTPTIPAPAEADEPPAIADGLDFSDLKKKKKSVKKKAAFDLEAFEKELHESKSEEPLKSKSKKTPLPAAGDEDADLDMTLHDEAADAITDGLDFSNLKKKKKTGKKKTTFDLDAFEQELNESKSKTSAPGDEDEEEEDGPPADTSHLDVFDEAELGDDPFAQEAVVSVEAGNEAWLGSDRDYTYQELLTRFYNSLHAANPALLSSTGKRYTIAPPSIHRDGNKKSVFANVSEICKKMHRQPEHVIQYLFAEMGTTGSVDGAGRLVIRGRFQQKQIENVLRRYIVEYVTCKTCKSHDTLLTKENRIFFMACESCGSRRSVNAIKSGFQAQIGKRSKNKA